MIFRSASSKYDRTFSSDIVNATQNPVWNTNHIFLGVDSEEWASLKLEISVWNYSNHLDHKCLGMKIYTSIDKFNEIAIYIFQIGQKNHFVFLHLKELQYSNPLEWKKVLQMCAGILFTVHYQQKQIYCALMSKHLQ